MTFTKLSKIEQCIALYFLPQRNSTIYIPQAISELPDHDRRGVLRDDGVLRVQFAMQSDVRRATTHRNSSTACPRCGPQHSTQTGRPPPRMDASLGKPGAPSHIPECAGI